jgi:glyoxalase family protein
MGPRTVGIHHVTAIAGDPQRNLDFYEGILGLRLVKKTVNFDDPGTYHLYYGNEIGHPGTIMTFFPWPGAVKGRRGTGQLAATAFAIPEGWRKVWYKRDHVDLKEEVA